MKEITVRAEAERLGEVTDFVNAELEALGNRLITNASRGRLINEFNAAFGYELLPVEQIPGEYATGRDGFIEYHTQADDVTQWVLKAAYRPAEQGD